MINGLLNDLQILLHTQVAVFLMDTQGLFDDQETIGSDSLLFALSLLLSSYQIYNIFNNIDSSDLNHLRVCLLDFQTG